MKLHQIRSVTQSKMGVIFRLHLAKRKIKKTLNQLLESCCCTFARGPSLDEELCAEGPHWSHEAFSISAFYAQACRSPRLKKVDTNREGCNHPWIAFQTVLQASRQWEGPYFAFYMVLKSLQSTQLKYVASIKLRADYYRANSCHVIRNTGNVLRKGCLVLLISSFVFQVWFPENGEGNSLCSCFSFQKYHCKKYLLIVENVWICRKL